MKKLFAILFILAILGGTVVENKAMASADELPPVMKHAYTIPIEQLNHLDY